jgi:hypothetical protein
MSDPAPAPASRPARPRAAARAAWVERLARFHDSGLRPAQFCAQQGVSLPSFYAWKRRLAAAAPDSPGADPGPRLLPVRLAGAGAAVELALPGGAVLRVGPGADEAALAALLRLLGVLPC